MSSRLYRQLFRLRGGQVGWACGGVVRAGERWGWRFLGGSRDSGKRNGTMLRSGDKGEEDSSSFSRWR